MNKCLVTTLKAQTNNAALSKYNVLTIKTKVVDSPTLDSQFIQIGASENGGISVNSSSVGLYKTEISGELLPYPYTVLANGRLFSHFENKDGIIEVTGKYNINSVTVGISGIVRINEFYGIPGTIKNLVVYNIEEEEVDATKLCNALNISTVSNLIFPISQVNVINKLSKNRIVEFASFESTTKVFCKLFEDFGLDDLANNVNLTSISFNNGVKGGNLSSLAKLTKLRKIGFGDLSQTTGDIMDFINPWIQAGRTSDKIQVNWLLNQKNVTLNGQPITYPEGVDNSSAYLNWTSDGTVTFTAS